MEQTTEDLFSYIKQEETAFQTHGVPVVDGWDFEMYNHIRKSELYKYGQLANRVKTDNDPVINIILPILNVAYRVEDVDLKDIIPYVDDPQNNHKSLLVKKFHDRWARQGEFEMDEFLDDLKESKIDFGLVLVKKGRKFPEVVPLQRLAFCDQTDVLAGPICEKHQFSIDQLQEMKGRWRDEAIDEAIEMARAEKAQQQVQGQSAKTPGKYIEVYELHGILPQSYNPDIENPEPDVYDRHAYYVTYYRGRDAKKENGIILFHGAEKELIYEAHKRDKIFGRACGYGGVEELFEPQVWHTYSAIQKKEMLDVAANMVVKAIGWDPTSQRITDLEKGEFLKLDEGQNVEQLVLTPINWSVFDNWQEDMKLTAQTQGSANDPQLGVEAKAGTPFALQRLTTAQGMGIHQYRQGKMATFIGKLYRKWFLKQMVAEMNKGDKWLDVLTLDELKDVAEKVSVNKTQKRIKQLVLEGKTTTQAEMEAYREEVKKQVMGEGKSRERFLEIIKDEFKDIPIDVKVSVKNKQKNLIEEADKIIAFVRAIVGNPMLLQDKGWADLMNQVIEKYGLNPVDFQGIGQYAAQQQPQQQPQGQMPASQTPPTNPQLAPA